MTDQEIAILKRIEAKLDILADRVDRITSIKPKQSWQEMKRIQEHNDYELSRRG